MSTKYRWDDFVLDLDAYRLERAGTPVALEPKALNLLAHMVRRPCHLFTKQELFEAVWPDVAVTDHALTRVVAQLRRVLGDEAREARYLETVPTRGYRWVRPVEVVAPAPAIPAPAPVAHAVEPSITSPAPTVPTALPPTPDRPHFTAHWIVAATALAVVALTLAVWAQRNAPPASATAAARAATLTPPRIPASWPIQATTHAGLEMHPAFSPDGDAVAFVADRTGAFEIYVRALKGPAAETPLTRDGTQNVQPSWSPDGRFVAYHSYGLGGIWIVAARGGAARQVAATGSKPCWSPDGERLVFQSDEHADVSPDGFGAQNGSTLWTVRADGTDLRPLTRGGEPIGGHSSPVFSPNGRFVAFGVYDGGPTNGTWMVDVAGGKTWPVTDGARGYEVAFAPDGQSLFVAGGEPYVIEVPLDPATARPRGPLRYIPVPGVPGIRGMTISPDGRRLGFAGLTLSSQIWTRSLDGTGRPSAPPRALTSDTSRRNSWPSISPDGTRVAYTSTRRGDAPNVWTMRLDGGEATQLTADEHGDFQPRWLSDGRRVAFLTDRDAGKTVWTVDTVTRREALLIDLANASRTIGASALKGRLAEMALAPSLTTAVFSLMSPPAGRRVMYVADMTTLAARPLTPPTLSVGYPAWDPDERRVAVEVKDDLGTQAAILDVSSGALRMLTHERGQTWVRSWSPDGRRIAVAALRAGVWDLRWIDVSTGAEGPLTEATPPNIYQRYPEWSPKGDAILFERAEMTGDLWLLAIR